MSLVEVPSLLLSDGNRIPMLGLGTYDSTDEQELITAVKTSISAGYRHFDCAYFYNNENIIGKAIHESIAESNGNLKREDFYIVSKCWNTFHSRENVFVCLDKILANFKFDYIDLYLIHWPFGLQENGDLIPLDEKGLTINSDIHFNETYQAMEELVAAGKVKSIGISNFNIAQTKEILKICKIKPVCNQVEVNPYFRNEELAQFCHDENIAIVAYAPLRSATYSPGKSWLSADILPPQDNLDIVSIAKKYNKSTAQVILRWLVQRNIVVIPKSVTPARIVQNAQIFDFELSSEDMSTFKNLVSTTRINHFEVAINHPLYPFLNE